MCVLYVKIKKSIGMKIPAKNSMPPRPQKPLAPFTMKSPVNVMMTNAKAKMSEKAVHQYPGL